MRKIPFAAGEFFHVYNRGVDKRTIFTQRKDFDRFLQSMEEFNTIEPIGSLYENNFFKIKFGHRKSKTSKLVNVVCYCLNPNHYHLILEPVIDDGISEFMRRLSIGYTKYFNIRYKRNGVLFQGRFKSSHINSNEYLLYTSAYVNLNNLAHRLRGETFRSSWSEYISSSPKKFCENGVILKQFRNRGEYKTFAEDSLPDIIERKKLAKELELLLLE